MAAALRELNWRPASRHPSGSSTHVWPTRVVNAISCPRQSERLRCTHRTIAA